MFKQKSFVQMVINYWSFTRTHFHCSDKHSSFAELNFMSNREVLELALSKRTDVHGHLNQYRRCSRRIGLHDCVNNGWYLVRKDVVIPTTLQNLFNLCCSRIDAICWHHFLKIWLWRESEIGWQNLRNSRQTGAKCFLDELWQFHYNWKGILVLEGYDVSKRIQYEWNL